MFANHMRITTGCFGIALAVAASPVSAAGGDHAHHDHHGTPAAVVSAEKVPALSIVMPKPGERLTNPAAVVLVTDGDIESLTMSAAKTGIHLHVSVDGKSVMPIREQLISVGAGRYVFVLEDGLGKGAHEISVYWADAAHKTISKSIRTVNVIGN